MHPVQEDILRPTHLNQRMCLMLFRLQSQKRMRLRVLDFVSTIFLVYLITVSETL